MLLELLELASNKTLEHDLKSQARLARLQGKSMTLQIMPIAQSITVRPQPEGLEFIASKPDKVDVTLTATVGAMIKISRHGLEEADLQPGELEIAGDPIVGQRFAQIIADLDIDWEALLAEQIGDSPARVVSLAAGQAREFAVESQARLKRFLSDVLKEDLGVVADKHEVDEFLDGVDGARADADRLASRIKRLKSELDH